MADATATQRRRRRCMDGGVIEALPEDVLLEVFSRVGSVRDLFVLAVTCRRWLRRFTDPAFLRGLCRPGQRGEGEGHRARLLGFLLQKTGFVYYTGMMEVRAKQHASAFAPIFLPAPGSLLGPTERALASLVADGDGTFNYAEPMAARRGFVLMKLVPRTSVLMTDPTIRLLGLCNPITGERHLLPPLKIPDRTMHSYAIITAADDLGGNGKQPPAQMTASSGRRGSFSFSQLLVTTQLNDRELHLHSYSAATRSWSEPTVCLDRHRFSIVGNRSAVIHQGAAHWLCVDNEHQDGGNNLHKLSVEVGTTCGVTLTKLHHVRGGGSPILSVGTDGSLAVACVYFAHVSVWTQQGGGTPTEAWPRTTTFRIPPPMMHTPCDLTLPNEQWFDFSRGSMLGLYRSGAVFIIDLEKKAMEKVMDCFWPIFRNTLTRYKVLAYEVDLVEFFILQLGGLAM